MDPIKIKIFKVSLKDGNIAKSISQLLLQPFHCLFFTFLSI